MAVMNRLSLEKPTTDHLVENVVFDEKSDSSHPDPATEKKLLLKCDQHVLPPLFILLLLAFLDRTNIGKIQRLFHYAITN